MERETICLHGDIINYMESVKVNNLKSFKKLNSMIQKLAENGHSIIDGRMYKKMRTGKRSKLPIIQIEIRTKQYRIHTVLTPNYLYLLHAFDKKKNKTSDKDLSLSIQRAKNITL